MSKAWVNNFGNIYKKIVSWLSSHYFFYGVVGLSVLQGLWYALTFKPFIFDESVHIGIITIYSHQLSPFISQQLSYMDKFGEVIRNPSYLYYYLMSWPLRLITVFTHSTTAQIIFLRFINIALFAAGLVIYKRLLAKSKLPAGIINLTLLFVILTPSLAMMSGAVSYDNAIFLLSGLTLLLALQTLSSKRVSFQQLAWLAVVGLMGSLIKFQFLAFIAPVILFVCYQLWRRRTFKWPFFVKSYKKLSLVTKILIVSLLIISTGLFIERPVVNMLKYHEVNPRCTKIIRLDRCKQNYTSVRNNTFLANKSNNFVPINPFNYLLKDWLPILMVTQTNALPFIQSSLLIHILYYPAVLGGILIIMLYLRNFIKNRTYKLLLFAMAIYALCLIAYGYQAYVHYAQPLAISNRYLLPIMPIFIAFVGLSLVRMFEKYKAVLLIGLIAVVLIFTQGGGISTYLIAADSSYYWPNTEVSKTNNYLKINLQSFIKLRASDNSNLSDQDN